MSLFHSPPSQSVHGQKRIEMEDQHEPERPGTVHLSEAYIQDSLKDTFKDMTLMSASSDRLGLFSELISGGHRIYGNKER